MIYSFDCTALSAALEQLKTLVKETEQRGQKTVIFCEDRLTLAAERTVCSAVGGTFLTSVYTFARFLSSKTGKRENVLSSQGSAMAVRKIIEDNRDRLTLFKKLSSAGAALSVYDTLALLYSSRVTPADAFEAGERGGILGEKLRDLSIIYEEYEKFLKESGKTDRNAYLRRLPEIIGNSPEIRAGNVVFLGFQSFTCTSQECVRAAFSSAANVYGLFIGGKEEIYVNEACAFFEGAAKEYGGAETQICAAEVNADAEHLRKSLFNPESYFKAPARAASTGIFEAADGEQEFEFIAARIKKHVIDDGERYAKISVMLPDIGQSERALSRVFARFKIPYYADRQIPLSEHPLCAFTVNLLVCVTSGCRFADVDSVVASPFFPAERGEKDIFRNYLMRLANYRGGVKKQPDAEVAETLGFDIKAVERVRKTFLDGLALIPAKGGKSGICRGLRSLFEQYGVEKKLDELAEAFRDERPAAAQFSKRAYDSVLSVIGEAESIASDDTSLSDLIKIFKSGFAAMKISLIPPKADAVFVGDLAATANTGSNIVFAARLTGEVPSASSDDSLLTDREIAALESVNLNISPKIRQVNARKKETCALNICAFRKKLYLSYTADEEVGESEIISYARRIFVTENGAPLAPVAISRIEESAVNAPYYCSEKLSALRYLCKYPLSPQSSSVYEALKRKGCESDADAALQKHEKRDISCGLRLYTGKYNSLAPTTLESYFSCPYLSFISKGLKARERDSGAVRPVDTGNFIHAVLQDLAKEIKGGLSGAEETERRAREIAEEKLKGSPYSALADSGSGKYVGDGLVEEAVAVSKGMYEQLENSSFKVLEEECAGEVYLDSGVKVFGRIDRVDESGGMVRVIDYKTGAIDSAAKKYYTGAKLQLPLYLLSASKGRRAVGAYYFPASVEYREKEDGVFRLQGFMDGSDEVVSASDSNVKSGEKSGYVNAYYRGRALDNAMSREDFSYFLEYSRLVADVAVREMTGGNVTPSPAEGTCEYCKMGGACGVTLGRDIEERKTPSVKCSQISRIAKKALGGAKEDGDDSHV